MDQNVGKEVAALKRMTVNELRARYADVFGEQTNARHKEWLVRRIIWRIQAAAEGDVSQRARQRAAELANDADLRTSAPKFKPTAAASMQRTKTSTVRFGGDNRVPMPGSIIARGYKGQTLQVRVLPKSPPRGPRPTSPAAASTVGRLHQSGQHPRQTRRQRCRRAPGQLRFHWSVCVTGRKPEILRQ